MNSWLFGVLVCVFPICVPLAVIVINNLGSRRGLPEVFSELPEICIGTTEGLNYGVQITKEKFEGHDKLGETLPGGRASPRDESPPSGVHEVVLKDGGFVRHNGWKESLSLPPGAVVKWCYTEAVDLIPMQELERDQADHRKRVARAVINMQKAEAAAAIRNSILY